eukprot:15459333-Alexandrium_andersonii.AAC.1
MSEKGFEAPPHVLFGPGAKRSAPPRTRATDLLRPYVPAAQDTAVQLIVDDAALVINLRPKVRALDAHVRGSKEKGLENEPQIVDVSRSAQYVQRVAGGQEPP